MLKLLSLLKNEINDNEIVSVMNFVGLDPFSKTSYKHYSTGMKQKLKIAQALMEKPKVLILDEPFNGLDEDSVKMFRQKFLEMNGGGITFIITSHYKENIYELCNRVYRMNSYRFIKSEIDNYALYEDFSRASIIMLLSFNKELDIQYSTIRDVQKMTTDYKVTEGDLIKDFAEYDIIPILSYIKGSADNQYLIESFQEFSEFITNFKRYRKDADTYIYEIQKDVISKDAFQKAYQDFMYPAGSKNIEEHVVKLLLKNDKVRFEYNYEKLKMQIEKNYSDFYNDFEKEILLSISQDLKEFEAYLKKNYMSKENETNGNALLETETLNLEFKVYRNDREYTGISKYYLYNYIVDLDDVWSQLSKLGYPKLYM